MDIQTIFVILELATIDNGYPNHTCFVSHISNQNVIFCSKNPNHKYQITLDIKVKNAFDLGFPNKVETLKQKSNPL